MKFPSILTPVLFALAAQGLTTQAFGQWQAETAMPKEIPLDQIYIKDFTASGSGCAAGTFEKNLSPDKKAFTITYSDFYAEIGPNSSPANMRKNCAVTLNLNIPAGYQYTVGKFNYRGFISVDPLVRAEMKTLYFFQGNGGQGEYTRTQDGPFNDTFVYEDLVGLSTNYVPETWSPCNVQRALTLNPTISLSKLPGAPFNAAGTITNDSIDGELTQEFGIAYRRCGETTPPVDNGGGTDPNPDPNPNPNPTNGLVNGKVYNIVSRYNGQCLDVRDHSLAEGAVIQQWNCTGEAQQKFKAIYLRDGRWALIGEQSGKYVSILNGWGDDGNGAVQYNWLETDHQKMYIDRSNSGSYKIKFSHSQRCLDIEGPNFQPGTRTMQMGCDSSKSNQDWFFQEPTSGGSAPQPGVEYQLVNRLTGKCFDVFDHGVANGTRLQQWSCTGEAQQYFRLQDFGGGNYSLVGRQSQKTVTVRDWAQWNGAEIIIWDDQWGANQRVNLVPSANGSYQVKFTHSGKCLDLDSGNFNDGAKLQQWDCQIGNPNQDWILKR